MIYLNQTIVRIIGTLIINNSLVLGDESKMNKVYAVKDLDTGLYLSEVAGCILPGDNMKTMFMRRRQQTKSCKTQKVTSKQIDLALSILI